MSRSIPLAIVCLLTAALGGLPDAARAEGPTLSTAQIIPSAYSFACARWKVVGTCFWLHCSLGCSVKTSVKVEHYNPDLVVSSYHNTGANPWNEIRPLVQSLTGGQGGGNSTERAPEEDHTNVRFKNTDAVGSPALASFSSWLSSTGLVCDSAATMFQPYFISSLDTLGWRHGVPDMLYSPAYTPYLRDIRLGQANWGGVYPRSGFILQGHDYKAGAVTAQRAGDIVTRSGEPHVYTSVSASWKPGWWPPDPLLEGDSMTGDWQMLLPARQMSCATFPPVDDTRYTASDPYAGQVNEFGDYVWHLWRPYQCCKKKGQVYLFSVGGKAP